jgi:tRNA(Ile)-lysidine synthase
LRRDELLESVAKSLRFAGCHKSEHVLVAVSGGVDSMVLLDVLQRLQTDWPFVLCVVHLDHCLRLESLEDERFVAREAQRRELSFRSLRCDVAAYATERHISIEEAGREQRYAFFAEVAAEVEATKVVLGHHMDDQAETVLMRLLRGSAVSGLKGMVPLRDKFYLRPLLSVRRIDIEAYANERSIAFREDITNKDRRFLRNRVRGELLPLLREYNPHIVEAIHRTTTVLRAEDSFVEEMAQNALNASLVECCVDKIVLDAPCLVSYHIALLRRVIRTVLQGFSAGKGPYDFARIEQIIDLLKMGDGGPQQLGGELRVQCWQGRLIVRRGVTQPIAVELVIPGFIEVPDRSCAIVSQLVATQRFRQLRSGLGGGRAAFDAEKLGANPLLRSTLLGDRFQPLGMSGQKKVSDFLIDLKYPRILRDEVLVVESRGEIAWVVGLRSGHPFRVRADSRQIAVLEFSS